MVAHALRRSTFRLAPFALALLAAGCSCSCSGGAPAEPAEAEAGPPAAPESAAPASAGGGERARKSELVASADEALDDATNGGLHVLLRFEGEVPERPNTGAVSSKECQHNPDVDQRRNELLVADGKLANVFVTLKSGVDRSRVPPAPTTPIELDQNGCMYTPRVVALRVGQELHVRNSDPATHNVNLQAKRNKSANRSMGIDATRKPLVFTFDQRELGITVKCDIHPWMGAQIHVEDHPWFGLSDAQGRVTIAGIPPGEYTVEARHETLGQLSGKITVVAGSSAGLEGVFRAK